MKPEQYAYMKIHTKYVPQEIIDAAKNIAEVDLGITADVTASAPGDITQFTISFGNPDASELQQVVIIIVIPEGTVFVQAGSGVVPLADVQGASVSQEVADTEWQLLDGSGLCPDGAPSGTVCAIRLGDLASGASGQVTVNTRVDENAQSGDVVALNSRLDAADFAEAKVFRLSEEATIDVNVPTALDEDEESNQSNKWFSFLPFINK